jgi:hypothetical protein
MRKIKTEIILTFVTLFFYYLGPFELPPLLDDGALGLPPPDDLLLEEEGEYEDLLELDEPELDRETS